MDPLSKENDVKNSAEAFFSLKSASEAEILVIVVVQKTSIWPEFGWEKKSMTRIEPVADVNMTTIWMGGGINMTRIWMEGEVRQAQV